VQPTGAVNDDRRNELRSDRIGPFRILKGLATAGGRDAFLAEDENGRRVILKVLGAPDGDLGSPDPRIADEVAAYARLSHPNLVRAVDVASADGFLVVALENVEGCQLNGIRGALAGAHAQLDDVCSLYIGACIFGGLAAAHAAVDSNGRPAPVLHRSINPSNVFISRDGSVKIGNFSVASIADGAGDSNPGLTWGSYGYFAPEQARAQPIGPHTDVYSAMLVLWELLAGRKAIERGADSAVELLDRMAAASFPSLDELRPDLDARVRAAIRVGLQPGVPRRGIGAARAHEIFASVIRVDSARQRLASALGCLPSEMWPGEHVRRVSPPPPPRRRAASPGPLPRPAAELDREMRPATESASSIDPTSHSTPALPLEKGPRRTRAERIALLGVAALALFGAGFLLPLLLPPGSMRPLHDAAPQAIRPTAATTASTFSPEPSAATPAAAASQPLHAEAPAPSEPAPVEGKAPDVPATPDEPPIPGDMGELQLPSAAAGHRIFVDGRTVSEGTAPIRVACGPHAVRIGSAGRLQQVDVPCGDALALTR
jgi:serine/threonine-protein kinase